MPQSTTLYRRIVLGKGLTSPNSKNSHSAVHWTFWD
jgi:hypothetical protein